MAAMINIDSATKDCKWTKVLDFIYLILFTNCKLNIFFPYTKINVSHNTTSSLSKAYILPLDVWSVSDVFEGQFCQGGG